MMTLIWILIGIVLIWDLILFIIEIREELKEGEED